MERGTSRTHLPLEKEQIAEMIEERFRWMLTGKQIENLRRLKHSAEDLRKIYNYLDEIATMLVDEEDG